MPLSDLFAIKTKEVIGESRIIAIELGYNYVSTIHIFLADCKINDHASIRNFVFKDSPEFQTFFDSQKIGEPTIFADDLPLTLEAEQTIRKSVLLFHHNFKDVEIHPYHLFLAASRLRKTLFYSILKHGDNLPKRLKEFYINTGVIDINTGVIDIKNVRGSVWTSLAKKLFHRTH